MGKVLLYMAVSADGYIAISDGSVDWLETEGDLGERDCSLEKFLQRIGTIAMGRKSYDQLFTFGEWPFPSHKTLVFSSSSIAIRSPNTEVICDFSPDELRHSFTDGEKDIWLFGGGCLNHHFLTHDLIDEAFLFVQPIFLGGGVPLFGGGSVE